MSAIGCSIRRRTMKATNIPKSFVLISTLTLSALGLAGCVVVGPGDAGVPQIEAPLTDAPLEEGFGPPSSTSAPPTTTPPAETPPTSAPSPAPTPEITTQPPGINPAAWPQTVAQVQSGIVQISVTTCDSSGTGSGFLIAPDLVVTAAHVVADASAVDVSTSQGNAPASVLGINELADLALVQTSRPLNGYLFGFEPRIRRWAQRWRPSDSPSGNPWVSRAEPSAGWTGRSTWGPARSRT
ncbi:trypsin-like serine protease [Vibrio cholerae]|nr:trypsin-like serine protease [Vibrio cholerae]